MYPDSRDEVVQLYLDDIIPNRFQPREVFDERALKELAVSIKEHGVIQPIIVRNVNGKYEIIAGERRYKASALAGLTKIPAIIRDLDDKESSKVALLENLQRKNLNPIEEARTYQKILEIDQMTQEELAKTMGKSQSAVANKIRLLSLTDEVQEALLKEQISERHARTLLNISDANQQKEMLKKVIETKMTVRALEEEIKNHYPKASSEPVSIIPEPISQKDKVASASAFVNDNPLMPTAELPKDESNYGKVTIAPPDGENMNESKYINFNNTEDFDDGNSSILNLSPIISTTTEQPVSRIPSIVENREPQAKEAELDNLLTMGNPTSSIPSTNYITPAEKIVKQDPQDDFTRDTSSDYFKASDISSIHIPAADMIEEEKEEEKEEEILDVNTIPSAVTAPATISSEPQETLEEEKMSVEEATNNIRNLVKELQTKGINIYLDEMNFDKTYQMIIKIEK